MSPTRSIGLYAVDRGPLSPAEPSLLRTGSAVAQRDLLHAEVSFHRCTFQNGVHRSPITHAPRRVGPWYSLVCARRVLRRWDRLGLRIQILGIKPLLFFHQGPGNHQHLGRQLHSLLGLDAFSFPRPRS